MFPPTHLLMMLLQNEWEEWNRNNFRDNFPYSLPSTFCCTFLFPPPYIIYMGPSRAYTKIPPLSVENNKECHGGSHDWNETSSRQMHHLSMNNRLSSSARHGEIDRLCVLRRNTRVPIQSLTILLVDGMDGTTNIIYKLMKCAAYGKKMKNNDKSKCSLLLHAVAGARGQKAAGFQHFPICCFVLLLLFYRFVVS